MCFLCWTVLWRFLRDCLLLSFSSVLVLWILLYFGLVSVRSIEIYAGLCSFVDTRIVLVASVKRIRSSSFIAERVLISFWDPRLCSGLCKLWCIVFLAGVFVSVTLAKESSYDILVISAKSIGYVECFIIESLAKLRAFGLASSNSAAPLFGSNFCGIF